MHRGRSEVDFVLSKPIFFFRLEEITIIEWETKDKPVRFVVNLFDRIGRIGYSKTYEGIDSYIDA